MLEMARLVSRRASTTSSMLVIKMDRSFTTTIRMALLCMAGWLQSFCKVYMRLRVWILWYLGTIIKKDTTWQCTIAVTVAMLAPAVGVLQTMKFTWKVWDKLRNLVGRMSTFISSAHGSYQWRTKKHSRGAQWNNEKALQQEWFLRIQEKAFVHLIWMGMYWLTLHILQDVLITAPSSSSSLVAALFNSKRVATFKDLMVPLCTLGSTLKWFVQLQVSPEAARLRGQTWWTWTIMFFAGCDKFKKFGQILQFF